MALAARVQGKSYKTHCVMGDARTQEGQVWEALMTGAPNTSWSNLICILDNNKIQMCGTNEEIMPLGDICKKYESFGWRVIHIDGHDIQQIVNARWTVWTIIPSGSHDDRCGNHQGQGAFSTSWKGRPHGMARLQRRAVCPGYERIRRRKE